MVLSFILSGLAVLLVYQYISGEESKMEEQYAKFDYVLAASRDILQFETIRPTDIELIQVPRAMLPPGYLTDPKDIIDAVAAIPLTKGEFILDNKIISKNIYSGLDTQVSIGRRAISMFVNVKSAVGYMLRPGNRVDLAAHFDYKATGINVSETKTFLQDLLVLAVGRTIQTNPPQGVDQNIVQSVLSNGDIASKVSPQDVRETLNYATITLEVTPEQAQIIVFVISVYPDSLVCLLRHSDDRALDRHPTSNLAEIMGPDSFMGRGPKAPPPKAVVLPKFTDVVGGESIVPR